MNSRSLQVNVLAPSICTREAIKQMTAKGVDGHVFNINRFLLLAQLPSAMCLSLILLTSACLDIAYLHRPPRTFTVPPSLHLLH